jgi:tRNA(fMet)-specific endonuclease VapC
MFLLDTDHIAVLQRPNLPEYGRLQQRMAAHAPAAFAYSIVSFHEQVLGANLYVSRARAPTGVVHGYSLLGMVLDTFARIQVLSFDPVAANLFDSLRAQRVRIGTMDLRIAATALTRGLVVLTRNTSDFNQVPGLSVQDWTT